MNTWHASAKRRLSSGWGAVRDAVLSPVASEAAVDDAQVATLAVTAAPVVWLLGKVQSGKTSIVHALTRASAAEIGEGYKACTRTAAVFDFPAEAPVIRFLDTRGLGERGYDAVEDLAFHAANAHLILAVVKALDPQQDAVLDVLRKARAAHPDWPVIVAQTTLHDAYRAGQTHAMPYPYDTPLHDLASRTDVSPQLLRALQHQREEFEALPGRAPVIFVPLDFTKVEDGFEPRDYGLEALLTAFEQAAPASVLAALAAASAPENHKLDREAHPHIMGYATAAAAADAVPAAGAVAVPVVQSKMLHSLGRIYGVTWNRRALGEFAACIGAGAVSRMAAGFGLRQLVKLIPVYGQTAGAAAAAATSFATTFAIGKAACYFLSLQREGKRDPKGVERAYRAALTDAFTVFRERGGVRGAV